MSEDKKSAPNKKSGNNPSGDDNQPKNKNRFNIYWIYGIVFAAIVGYNFLRTATGTGVETNQVKFTELIKQGDVEKITTIRNKKIVRIFIKKDSLQNKAFYKEIFGKQFDNAVKMPAPQLYFSIVDDKTFAAQMQDFYTKNPAIIQIPDSPTDEGELFGQLISTLLHHKLDFLSHKLLLVIEQDFAWSISS